MSLATRALWSDAPPEPRTYLENYPTLLFSWWCTAFSIAIICFRLAGRKVRTNVLFREDRIMAFALIPLLIRMALVHVILLYGTNNVATSDLSPAKLARHATGARLVLASRIFYAMFIWTCKYTVSEFLKRLPSGIWRRSYELWLRGIRIFLLVTFIVVVISTISECQPFHHYWQVVPDPGPRCRQGFAQLIAMGTCDIITDILLIAFPIPIILHSGMTMQRKASTIMLFSLSLILIGITGTRVPEVIVHHGRQQYRTVWASAEILAAAAVSNAVVLGSFVRDKGEKKRKYRHNATLDSIERTATRRPTLISHLGSDEDLFRDVGCRVPALSEGNQVPEPRPAPVARPADDILSDDESIEDRPFFRTPEEEWKMTPPALDLKQILRDEDSSRNSGNSDQPSSPKEQPSLFDVGGLLEDGPPPRSRGGSASASLAQHAVIAQDFASSAPTTPRQGSRIGLSDVGGLLTPTQARATFLPRRRRSSQPAQELQERKGSRGVEAPRASSPASPMGLQDVGGLLR